MKPIAIVVAAGAILSLSMARPGSAQEAEKRLADEWSFAAAPYVWFASLDGDLAVFPALPAVEVDASFREIFKNLDPSLMFGGEIRNGRFGLLADIVYVHLTADGPTPGPLFSGVEADVKNFIGTFEGAYRVVDTESVDLDVLGGIRVWSVTSELSFSPGILAARTAENTESWVDPMVGVRARVDVGSGFFLNAWGNVGGFGVVSDIDWDIFGGVGYEWNDWLSSFVGYRHLEIDYDDAGFLYDVVETGPVIGAILRF
jgi:hypothetical protein